MRANAKLLYHTLWHLSITVGERTYKKWLFLIIRFGKLGKDPVADVSANDLLTDTDTQADAPKGLCSTFAETTTALTDGKPITKLRFPPVVAIRFPTARSCVCLATKRPVLTVDTDF